MPHAPRKYERAQIFWFLPGHHAAGGLWEQDDGENWNEIQKVLRGYVARQNKLNAQMGIGHVNVDVGGLPSRTNNVYGEEAARGMYARWADLMQSATWDEVAARERQRGAQVLSAPGH